MLKDILDKRIDLQKHLFVRGFLITNNDISNMKKDYPFYNNWNIEKIDDYYIWYHNLKKLHTYEHNHKTFFMIGHAYNPFTMKHDESKILSDIAATYHSSENEYYNAIDELTGVFIMGYIEGGDIHFLLDCSGMQYGCYGEVDGKFYISSHMQLIGDILGLTMDPFVEELINYKWYKFMMGNYLPGDLTAFRQLKRIIPNTYVDYKNGNTKVVRFYPRHPVDMADSHEEYVEVIKKASRIMHNNMKLIAEKWDNPAFSLTGGIDSNTNFASANGLYDRFKAFSYVSMHRESVDAEAAKRICRQFNVPHSVYKVPDSNEEIEDFDIYKAILSHNDGDIGQMKDNDVRKKITLMQNNPAEIEIKSWIGETIRAYAYKYFGRKTMPRDLKARHWTSLYKIFFSNRELVQKTDRYFAQYIEDTQLKEHLYNYDESDFFVWEMMHGGKCGLNIGTMKFCFDITIPYNNRKLIDMILRVPLRDRISDRHMLDLKKNMNRELYNMDIRVVNLNETRERKAMANVYFMVNSSLPF